MGYGIWLYKFLIIDFSHSLSLLTELTHICLVDPPILIKWASPFPILGVSDVHFHFHSILNRDSCKQTVKTLIRERGVWSGSALFAYVQKMGR